MSERRGGFSSVTRAEGPRRPSRLGLRPPIILVAPSLLVAALAATPLIYLFIRAAEAGLPFGSSSHGRGHCSCLGIRCSSPLPSRSHRSPFRFH